MFQEFIWLETYSYFCISAILKMLSILQFFMKYDKFYTDFSAILKLLSILQYFLKHDKFHNDFVNFKC